MAFINTIPESRDRKTGDVNKLAFSQGNKWDFTYLKYPLDLEGSPELSHYVVFYISVPEKRSGLKFSVDETKDMRKHIENYLYDEGGKLRAGRSNLQNTISQTATETKALVKTVNAKATDAATAAYNKAKAAAGGIGQAAEEAGRKAAAAIRESELAKVGMQGASTLAKKLETFMPAPMVFAKEAICLYIPESLTVGYELDWSMTDTRFTQGITKAAGSAIGGINSAIAGNYGDAASQTGDAILTATESSAGKIGDTLGLTGLTDVLSAASKTIRNPYMEAIFNGVQNRKYTMDFKFTPQTHKEAVAVHNIIQTFKKYALPEVPDASGAQSFYLYPGEFECIFYTVIHTGEGKGKAVKNKFLARYGRSVLDNIRVNYSGAGRTGFLRPEDDMGAPPIQTDLSLSFGEIDKVSSELITPEVGM